MRKIYVVFKKELLGFIWGPQFWIVLGLTATMLSWVFPTSLRLFEESLKSAMFMGGEDSRATNIHYGLFLRHLSFLNLLLIFITPALTMRLFAEEKKVRTMDLLLTAPLTSTQIVLGKFKAASAAMFILLVLAALYPLSMVFFTEFQWSTLLTAWGGLFLLSLVYVSMDLFCSSLTESGIIAYVMAVIFNVFIWFVGMGADVFDSATARAVFEHLSLNTHLSSLVEGTIRTSSLVFFFSAIAFFLFLTDRVVESARWR